MSISIASAKDNLYRVIGNNLTNEGFSFNKSKFEFAKKNNNNSLKLSFLFYNFTPDRVEFSFVIRSIINEIENIKKEYFEFIRKPYEKGDTLLFREGDFDPTVRRENLKTRAGFTHKLFGIPSDLNALKECLNNFESEVIPREHIFTSLEGFQYFILENHMNAAHYLLIFPSLLAALLKGNDYFNHLLYIIKEYYGYKSLSPQHINKQLIDSLQEFSKGRNASNN